MLLWCQIRYLSESIPASSRMALASWSFLRLLRSFCFLLAHQHQHTDQYRTPYCDGSTDNIAFADYTVFSQPPERERCGCCGYDRGECSRSGCFFRFFCYFCFSSFHCLSPFHTNPVSSYNFLGLMYVLLRLICPLLVGFDLNTSPISSSPDSIPVNHCALFHSQNLCGYPCGYRFRRELWLLALPEYFQKHFLSSSILPPHFLYSSSVRITIQNSNRIANGLPRFL